MNGSSTTQTATGSAPPSPAKRRHDMLEDLRGKLIGLPNVVYAGDSDTADKLTWFGEDGFHRIITKTALDTYRSEQAAIQDGSADTDKSEEPPSAVLAVIASITSADCWLTPDCNWKGKESSKLKQGFEKLQLSCTAAEPDKVPYHKDFSVALSTLKQLVGRLETPGFEKQGVVVVGEPEKREKIQLRHNLFTERAEGDTTDSENDGPHTVPKPDFAHISKWPVKTPEAEKDLAIISSNYRVIPLPAFDTDKVLINPKAYKKELGGCPVAAVFFTVTHNAIGSSKIDRFTAHIDKIEVIEPKDSPLSSTPSKPPRKKQRTNPFEPYLTSPLCK